MRKRSSLIALCSIFAVVIPAVPAHAATAALPEPEDAAAARAALRPRRGPTRSGVPTTSCASRTPSGTTAQARSRCASQIDPTTKSGAAIQRVYDDPAASPTSRAGSNFYWHAGRITLPLRQLGRLRAVDEGGYDAWIASGGPAAARTRRPEDDELRRGRGVHHVGLPNHALSRRLPRRRLLAQLHQADAQGLSPGWGDTYDYYRPSSGSTSARSTRQRHVRAALGRRPAQHRLREREQGRPDTREPAGQRSDHDLHASRAASSSTPTPPTGTVRINHVDPDHAPPNVSVKVLGRDDVSGVTQRPALERRQRLVDLLRPTRRPARPADDRVEPDRPDLRRQRNDGTKTVYVQFHDACGKWWPSDTDTIVARPPARPPLGVLESGAGRRSGRLLAAGRDRRHDRPSTSWRATTAPTATAPCSDSPACWRATPPTSAVVRRHERLREDPDLGARSARRRRSRSRPGSSRRRCPPPALPLDRRRKAESYSLQFNGPKLEFTIIQGGTRTPPAGAVRRDRRRQHLPRRRHLRRHDPTPLRQRHSGRDAPRSPARSTSTPTR